MDPAKLTIKCIYLHTVQKYLPLALAIEGLDSSPDNMRIYEMKLNKRRCLRSGEKEDR